MTLINQNVAAEQCVALGAPHHMLESYPNRDVSLGPGGLTVTRALPIRDRRMVGPWCFLDRFGPLSFSADRPMDVAPHPHIGLQTVTWLLEGEILHDDSLGSEATGRPGGVNLMTAGRGIAHAEQTPVANTGKLNGVQLWVALPDAKRQVAPSFQAVERVPLIESASAAIQVFAGSLAGATAPGAFDTSLVGADLAVHPGSTAEVGLEPGFEHAVLVLSGDCRAEGEPLELRRLYYLGTQRSSLSLRSEHGGRLLLIGGPPFPGPILMWWNFVARAPDEIAAARADWEAHRRFGDVKAYQGPRLDAPALARFARPNPVS
jgi:redox-sensitive bicupin YhaK (pirin superfamily)